MFENGFSRRVKFKSRRIDFVMYLNRSRTIKISIIYTNTQILPIDNMSPNEVSNPRFEDKSANLTTLPTKHLKRRFSQTVSSSGFCLPTVSFSKKYTNYVITNSKRKLNFRLQISMKTISVQI